MHTQGRLSACDDDGVLRSVTLGFVLSVLAAACALIEPPPLFERFEPPPPLGTVPMQVQVLNRLSEPQNLTISTPDGVLLGAVRPPSLPPGDTTTMVTLHVPSDGDWELNVDGERLFGSVEFETLEEGCRLSIDFFPEGTGVGCIADP